MTHKVSLGSLVYDFKRTNEGQGVQATRALTALVAFSVAFATPIPDNGVTGSVEASNAMLRPLMTAVISDVNELMMVDLGSIQDLTIGLYLNRYDAAWGKYRALEAFTVKQILCEAVGEDIWGTVSLWAERFLEAIGFYLQELKGQAA
ncbi:hypothetical protein pEaSNUABM11_00060 [Erwinia phage pEa_SNUABM_11]|nr:hypothetical protein pEaSNUABM11_00060 [Erwinia phage pEa_SNUABM_11]